MRKICISISCVVFVLATVGCERYVEVDSSPIVAVERENILAFVLDTSGSFSDKMFGGDELAYKFFLRASDGYFRDRMGPHDRILISQLSAENRTLLWEGAPLSLRRQFGSSESLRQFIEDRSDPTGSRVYAALADTLDYINHLPGVSEGRTEVCVLVLSDMMDNSPTQQQDQQRMFDALTRLSQTNNAHFGLYWVDQTQLSDCRRLLVDAGIQESVVECGVVDEPALPFFE